MLSCSVLSSSVTPWTIARQAPLSIELSWQEYWSGLAFPPKDLPSPGIEPTFPALTGRFFITLLPGKPLTIALGIIYYDSLNMS